MEEENKNYYLKDYIKEILVNWDYKIKKCNAYNISKSLNASQSRVYSCLRELVDENIIIKHKRGIYILKKDSLMEKLENMGDEQVMFRLKTFARLENKTENQILYEIVKIGLEQKIKDRETNLAKETGFIQELKKE